MLAVISALTLRIWVEFIATVNSFDLVHFLRTKVYICIVLDSKDDGGKLFLLD